MKTSRLTLGFGLLASVSLFSTTATAQVYSSNIVGYINLPIRAGDNLIANQLDNGTNNLNSLLRSGTGNISDGATFTKWNSAGNAFLPLSVYSTISDTWSINYDLGFGEGGLLNSSSQWTNTFVGSVVSYSNITPEFGGPLWSPNYPDGIHLIASPEPLGGTISSMFINVTGRLPEDGEWVRILNPATQTYTLTTFHTGTGWDNGNPILNVGEAAWFNLGPVNVPEPSTLAFGAFAFALMFAGRCNKRSLS